MQLVRRAPLVRPPPPPEADHLKRLADCAHGAHEPPAAPRAAACEACAVAGPLRACAACGHVGCCESMGAHARAHSRGADHPVIREVKRGGGFGFTWCYACGDYLT